MQKKIVIKLRALMFERNIKIKDIGVKTTYGASTISLFLNNKVDIKIGVLKDILKVIDPNLKLSDFLRDIGE